MTNDIVTVFGGSGFVGRCVVRQIAKSGARVRVAVRRPDDALVVKPMGDVGQITPVAANIRDDASVAAAVAGADAVVNLVGILYERGKQSFRAVQADGAGRVARAAKEAGASRLVQISAIGADPHSDSAYARSKGEGEAQVKSAFPGATIVRPSIVFGPEDDFFNRFAGYARIAPVLPLVGGGETRFQPVFVGDVADAVAAILQRDDTAGKTYELGGPKVYSFTELMELLLAEIKRHRLLVPVPFALAEIDAAMLDICYSVANAIPLVSDLVPPPPLTRDQVRMLRHDNVVGEGVPGLADFGITPTSLEAILPTYLDRYRRGGVRAA